MFFFKMLLFFKELLFQILVLLKIKNKINNINSNSAEFKKLRLDILKNKKKNFREINSLSDTFLFFHIQKTAGTSIGKNYLPKAFPKRYFNTFSTIDQSIKTREKIFLLSNEDFKKIKICFGHHVYLVQDLFPNSKILTFVRDPIDRAMSQYLYEIKFFNKLNISKVIPPFNKRPIPENTESFWDFFVRWGSRNYPFCNFNLQSSSILTFFNKMSLNEYDKIEFYLKKFDFIGIQNEIDKSFMVLNKKFDFPIIKFNKKLVNKNKRLNPPARIKKKILNLSKYDNFVYKYSKNNLLKELGE